MSENFWHWECVSLCHNLLGISQPVTCQDYLLFHISSINCHLQTHSKQVIKNILKNVKGCRDGSAKITETRCRDGSVQAKPDDTIATQVTPSLHLFYCNAQYFLQYSNGKTCHVGHYELCIKNDVGMGLLV